MKHVYTLVIYKLLRLQLYYNMTCRPSMSLHPNPQNCHTCLPLPLQADVGERALFLSLPFVHLHSCPASPQLVPREVA